MSLDTRFIPITYLQQYFVDKDTGLPLAAGIIKFFSDSSRTTPKQVYMISGTPPNYIYTAIGNTLTLSSVGTFDDGSGNDIVPYLFPYDGNASTSTNTVDLYYITVQSAGNVDQFTREGVPNLVSNSTPGILDQENFAPNGQFLLHNTHNTIPGVAFDYGIYNLDRTPVAPGGWSFERSHSSTATDVVTFNRYTQYQTIPSGSPRYEMQVARTAASAAGDAVCDIRLTFPDVNKFAGQTITFIMTGYSTTGSTTVGNLYTVKYFGAGGSTTVETAISSFSFTATKRAIAIPIVLDTNSGLNVGSYDDDFLQIAIRLPRGIGNTFSVAITDAFVAIGSLTISANQSYFPNETNGKFVLDSLSSLAQTTNPESANASNFNYVQDGSNLYLPMIMTRNGATYDYSRIGMPEPAMTLIPDPSSDSATTNLITADGGQYLTAGYSSLGIPYSRLQQKYMVDAVNGVPINGTGFNFSTGYHSIAGTTRLYLLNNQFGSGALAAESSEPTGFAFAEIHANSATTYKVKTYRYADIALYMVGLITACQDVNSGLIVNLVRSGVNADYTVYSLDTNNMNVAALGGTYFTYTSESTSYYVWFKINGSGNDPAPGGTGILIELISSNSTSDVCNFIVSALRGGAMTMVTPVAGNTIPANSWFSFITANGNKYYVWYNKGSGVDPTPSGYTLGIPVAITNSTTQAAVAQLTSDAINSTYFAVPDLHGMFLRGFDPNAQWDIDAGIRFSLLSNSYGTAIGSYEFDDFKQHNHQFTPSASNFYTSSGGAGGDVGTSGTPFVLFTSSPQGTISLTGGTQTTPVNFCVNWAIRY